MGIYFGSALPDNIGPSLLTLPCMDESMLVMLQAHSLVLSYLLPTPQCILSLGGNMSSDKL